MASQAEEEAEEKEFWEKIEMMFDRKFPIDEDVRKVINAGIKESRYLDPKEREEVIDAAVCLAYDIVTVAQREEEGKEAEIAKIAKREAEVYIKSKLEERRKTSFEQEASGPKASPEDFSAQGKEMEGDNTAKDDDEDNIEAKLEKEKKTGFDINQEISQDQSRTSSAENLPEQYLGAVAKMEVKASFEDLIKRLTVTAPNGEKHSDNCAKDFIEAKNDLNCESIKIIGNASRLEAYGRFNVHEDYPWREGCLRHADFKRPEDYPWHKDFKRPEDYPWPEDYPMHDDYPMPQDFKRPKDYPGHKDFKSPEDYPWLEPTKKLKTIIRRINYPSEKEHAPLWDRHNIERVPTLNLGHSKSVKRRGQNEAQVAPAERSKERRQRQAELQEKERLLKLLKLKSQESPLLSFLLRLLRLKA
ncbi:hypothetical protein AWC38_SpisGene20704 [Stylophora pistillata]|uniref:Uncharacterized protein n=1 Tax=Stylophora pistillata TaxID=50429 RepID=A0A2B4RBR0_STYPI|nr:hypothetical protein AWC38_SpisGene20704 [Stylophora pistillata]